MDDNCLILRALIAHLITLWDVDAFLITHRVTIKDLIPILKDDFLLKNVKKLNREFVDLLRNRNQWQIKDKQVQNN